MRYFLCSILFFNFQITVKACDDGSQSLSPHQLHVLHLQHVKHIQVDEANIVAIVKQSDAYDMQTLSLNSVLQTTLRYHSNEPVVPALHYHCFGEPVYPNVPLIHFYTQHTAAVSYVLRISSSRRVLSLVVQDVLACSEDVTNVPQPKIDKTKPKPQPEKKPEKLGLLLRAHYAVHNKDNLRTITRKNKTTYQGGANSKFKAQYRNYAQQNDLQPLLGSISTHPGSKEMADTQIASPKNMRMKTDLTQPVHLFRSVLCAEIDNVASDAIKKTHATMHVLLKEHDLFLDDLTNMNAEAKFSHVLELLMKHIKKHKGNESVLSSFLKDFRAELDVVMAQIHQESAC